MLNRKLMCALALSGCSLFGPQANAITNGDVFVSIFFESSTVAGISRSLLIDTGLDADALAANPFSFDGWVIGPSGNVATNEILDFINSNAAFGTLADFSFNAGGRENARTSALTTRGADGPPPLTFAGINSMRTNMSDFLTGVAGAGPTFPSDVNGAVPFGGLQTGNPGFHGNTFLWGNDVGGILDFTNEGGFNTPLPFNAFVFTGPSSIDAVEIPLGLFQLNNTLGTLTFTAVAPIPVPAAVWLFGSALLGLFGIARNARQNYQANREAI